MSQIKRLIVIGITSIICSGASAQYIAKCSAPNGGFTYCEMSEKPPQVTQDAETDYSKIIESAVMDAALNAVQEKFTESLASGAGEQATSSVPLTAFYNGYPGDVFALCSYGRPGRKDWKRWWYDNTCWAGRR